MYFYSSFIFIWILSVLSATRLVAGYRPFYRTHTSMDLAQPHHVPRVYVVATENNGDLPGAPGGVAPPMNARNLPSLDNNPHNALGLSPTEPPPSQTLPMSSAVLAARQIHNADYGASSSNTPSSSDSNSTSTNQSPTPPSSTTDSKKNQNQDQDSSNSATHGTDKRDHLEKPGVWDGRRLPRAASTRRMLMVAPESDMSTSDENSPSDKSIQFQSDNTSEESTTTDSSPRDDSNGTDNDQDVDSSHSQRAERTVAFRFRR